MHLIRDDIVAATDLAVNAFCQHLAIPRSQIFDWQRWTRVLPAAAHHDYSQALDFAATGSQARGAQTFLFDSEQILAFLAAVDRRLPPGDYPAPFAEMIIQFTGGIDETLFTTGARAYAPAEAQDEVLGLVIAMPIDPLASSGGQHIIDAPSINITAWYKSTAVNRVRMAVAGDGEIIYRPLDMDANHPNTAALQQDKQRIANLALLCLAYIHSPGIEVEHVEADAAINRRRLAKGKRALLDYYICHVRRAARPGQADGEGTGRHVSFRFDVSGHFRRLADGRTIWIRAHQRGLEHGLYKPKVYKVD
jgi:hypothetical protein